MGLAFGPAFGAPVAATQDVNNGWVGSGFGYGSGGGFIAPQLQIKDKRRSKKLRDNDMLFLSH